MMYYRWESTVTEGESEHEVYVRLRNRALDTYDDIIMSKSWYIYHKHKSPIAVFTFTRNSDNEEEYK